jgi:hypothetical protein
VYTTLPEADETGTVDKPPPLSLREMVGFANANPPHVTTAKSANTVFMVFCGLHFNYVTPKPSIAVITSPKHGLCQSALIEFMGPEILQDIQRLRGLEERHHRNQGKAGLQTRTLPLNLIH